ncbi:MAG: ABC transporter ATP-binding protein [Candidatus Limnocylindrales bacterium]
METCQLWKRYRWRGPWALQGVDLAVAPGRIVALVGPNGAGKSTLLRTWLGFERASRGTVLTGGFDPWRNRGRALRQVGYIPQQPSLYDELSVEEHVDLAAYLRGSTFDRGRALARIDELELPRRARAGELSGGQRAQLALGLVLAAGASILLLDEPLASLDPLARRQFLRVLGQSAQASGATVVVSSHIVRDVEGVCQDLIVLVAGRVRLTGPVVDVLGRHAVAPTVGATADSLVGRFPADGGELVLIRRTPGAPADGRPPTLEELVLGYLAAAAQPAVRAPADPVASVV